MSLVKLEGLTKVFYGRKLLGLARGNPHVAVDSVSLAIKPGESLGLVGESGSGKTTVGKLVLGLEKPTEGTVSFDGVDISAMNKTQLKQLRGSAGVVFQDPLSSLNPRMKIASSISEPLEIHSGSNRSENRQRVLDLLGQAGLDQQFADRYPHQLSGGERQRVCVARALALNPRLIVLDEPVASLDVSIRAQIINLLADLRQQHQIAYLYITHDLATVPYVCDRVAVMKEGEVVESGTSDQVINDPQTKYAGALVSSVPSLISRQ